MSQTITIRKGLDVNMKGKAEKVLVEAAKSKLFSIQPPNFTGLTPKLVVKVGDKVTIISGFHKNETGEVIKIDKKTQKVVVQGINFKFKHVKPKTENEIGEIKQFEAPIHHSNVKIN